MRAPVIRTYLLILLTVITNFVLWLDSFDRYIASRYHSSLSEFLPDTLFLPSQAVLQAMAPTPPATTNEKPATTRTATATTTAEPADTRLVMAENLRPDAQPGDATRPADHKATPATNSAANPVEPDLDAAPRVLFAGDSMMQGLAPLTIPQIKKSYPKGFFSDQSKQSTGLTVRRYFDWPTRIKEEIDDKRFDTLVIFLGPNDPWDIYEGGKRLIFPSDDWIAKYRSRVVEVMEYCRSKHVRVVWIGLPNMRDERLQKGASVENRIFREEAKNFGFDYLSTEEIIGPLNEPFRKYIDDPQKGRVTVRADDGIHFTPSGLRLINATLVELLRGKISG
jgi:hypothetical protein